MKSKKIKAIYCTKYGAPEVLQVQEIVKPTPKENEVLIKIHVATVTAADTMMRRGVPFYGRLFIGLTKPKFPVTGTGFAGKIEAIGREVTSYKIGDRVFGESIFGMGTNTEYITIAEDSIFTTIPDNCTYEEVASICDGPMTSLNMLREVAKIKKGQKVLVNGASGSLGTAAVQLAKQLGAEVTGVCSSTNIELVQSLGADKVIDYTKTDFTKNGEYYDIIYDTVGKLSYRKCKPSLSQQGVYVSPVLQLPLLFQMLKTSVFGKKRAMFDATGMRPKPFLKGLLKELRVMLAERKLHTVVDKRYSLEGVAQAHAYVDTGRKKWNIVILVNQNN